MSNEELQGYCLKCKEKRIIQNATPEWAANGSPGTRGTCPVCGGTIYKPVSYTHLRAHETVLDLVCRLLLDKKKTNVHVPKVYITTVSTRKSS